MAAAEEAFRRDEAIQDSLASLRQVEKVLGELGGTGSGCGAYLSEPFGGMARTHEDVMEVVRSLEDTRGVIQQVLTSQRIACPSGVLVDVEERLTRVLELFGSGRDEPPPPDVQP